MGWPAAPAPALALDRRGASAAAAAAAGKIDAVMVMTLTRSHHGMLWQQERSILGKRAVEGERSLDSCSGRRST